VASIPGLYFVIARSDRARFVRPDPEDRLHTVGIVEPATLRQNHVAASTAHGPSGLAHIRFAPLLARRISEDFAVDLFTDLVLVAPPDVLQELMGLVDGPTAASLAGSLARDLMTVPDLELWPWLLPWLQLNEAGLAPRVSSHKW
jgi:Protein required for attachment to host cells